MELFKPEFGLVFWMFLAFACLYFILAKWAWPFIIKSMDERAKLIDEGVAYAQEAKSKLDNAKRDADALVADARKQQADILRDAAKMKTEIIEQAKAEAAVEAKKVTDAAQVTIEQSRKESEHQLRQDVGAYALQIAEQVIRRNMSDDKAQRELVKKLLTEVESSN
ncbi:MAG: F0F1 ATP synthase subunit B [Muribaculaceae bacterium]|nr:F0F1 ATP synthase subunit B [Muribaculaceae bacterium]MBQ6279661.1 F0F1 ATP synthase subunit B [Muribaculaceae bacterium]MBR0024427.1 F0F1 ATP synthase subunit B [Muribaculaceae bacterium]